MHGYARYVFAASLNFTGMDAGSDLQAQLLKRFPDCTSALHGSGRAIKYGQHAVTGPLHKVSPIPAELAINGSIVVLEKIFPSSVSKGTRMLCGTDDVREEDRSEHPTRGRKLARPRQEFLDFARNVGVAGPWHMVGRI